jgi:hypothetical protein
VPRKGFAQGGDRRDRRLVPDEEMPLGAAEPEFSARPEELDLGAYLRALGPTAPRAHVLMLGRLTLLVLASRRSVSRRRPRTGNSWQRCGTAAISQQ